MAKGKAKKMVAAGRSSEAEKKIRRLQREQRKDRDFIAELAVKLHCVYETLVGVAFENEKLERGIQEIAGHAGEMRTALTATRGERDGLIEGTKALANQLRAHQQYQQYTQIIGKRLEGVLEVAKFMAGHVAVGQLPAQFVELIEKTAAVDLMNANEIIETMDKEGLFASAYGFASRLAIEAKKRASKPSKPDSGVGLPVPLTPADIEKFAAGIRPMDAPEPEFELQDGPGDLDIRLKDA